MKVDSGARVMKHVFEIRHLKQRIPGPVGPTCGSQSIPRVSKSVGQCVVLFETLTLF